MRHFFEFDRGTVDQFCDRQEAGQRLAAALRQYSRLADVLVLGLPRGGVPVAFEVADALQAPLDVFIVRKLGVPGYEELAMGAIATGGVLVLNRDVVDHISITREDLDAVVEEERRELRRRELAFRGHAQAPDIRGKTVILIDDGIATGSTMRAAIEAIKQQRPACLVVAAPVASQQAAAEIRKEVDEFVALMTPDDFGAVGQYYEDFAQTSDDEVRHLIERAKI
jgi:predicted phosphoribosyltransferase